jgi:hypothetical protein
MLACFHVQVQYAGQLQLSSSQRSKGKHNRSLKVAVQGLVLWPTPYTYITLHTEQMHPFAPPRVCLSICSVRDHLNGFSLRMVQVRFTEFIDTIMFSLKNYIPPGGGVEYLHRSPASRRRRRKGNPVSGGYNWATLFLRNINTGTWPSRLGESRV